jgi:polysaccharide export outer membrane protein
VARALLLFRRNDTHAGAIMKRIVLLGLVVGCAHETTPPPVMAQAEYRLGREDVVVVEVWKDPTLSAKVPVRPDGHITLPMIGDVQAEGRTTEELRREITEKLRPVVEQPVVSVMVSEINATRFYVLGEVAHPGAFPVRGHVTVVQALAMAGGPTEFANQRSVVVIRTLPDGKEQRFKVDARDVLAGNARALPLVAGDTVFVP